MPATNQLPIETPVQQEPGGGFSAFFPNPQTYLLEIVKYRQAAIKGSLEYDNPRMFNSIIIDPDSCNSSMLNDWVRSLFPEINNVANLDNPYEARNAILHHEPDLIFSDVGVIREITSINKGSFEIISMSEKPEDAIHALRNNMCGFISKPFDLNDVIISVQCAINKLTKIKSALKASGDFHLPHNNLIGIPTMEGIEFIHTDEIIRCEGLQKCTRIITINKTDVVSSYNIGEFRKLLESCGFFSCHKSHLINLKFVKKYTREGFIFFNANSKPVPLARRRKCDFLNQMKHL